MWALHYVFLPRLNSELQIFVDQWNNHGLRTAQHRTPLQLFVGRALELSNANLTAMGHLFGDDNQTVQPQHDADLDRIEGQVQIPIFPTPISEEALRDLEQSINPLSYSEEMGMDLYLRVLGFLSDNL